MAPACRVAALLTTARFTGLTPTLPEKIGTVVRPVTMRYPLRHRPLWDGGEDWEIPYWRGWSAFMDTKCMNSSCSASFRHLEEGVLFRLEADPTLKSHDAGILLALP